jgi:iron complex outermembrane receptor protein
MLMPMKATGKRLWQSALMLSTAACGLAAPSLAHAADADQAAADANSVGIQEIVVTANRTTESAQKAPVAVTVVSAADIISKGVAKPEDLNQIAPALQVQPTHGAFANYSVRGINSSAGNANSDPSISINYDGVPLGRASQGRGVYFDLERVEVLPGPQGTLYGRNASAGVINVIPQKARLGENGGTASFEYGNYNLITATAAANLALGETLAVRFSGQTITRDGYNKDGSFDQADKSGRIKLFWQPTEAFSLDLGADYEQDGGRGAPTGYFLSNGTSLTPIAGDAFAGPHGPGVDAVVATYRPIRRDEIFQRDKNWGVNATATLTTGIGDLVVIPAYRKSILNYNSEFQGAAIRYLAHDTQSSLEARLQSPSRGSLRYLLGFFYFDENVDHSPVFDNTSYFSTVISSQRNVIKTKAYAGFARLTWSPVETVNLTGGVRYTREDRTYNADQTTIIRSPFFNATIPNNGVKDAASYDRVTWRAAADWNPTSTNMVYASVETGFKAGGFYLDASVPKGSSQFRPEKVIAYTIGSKNRFLDNKLQLNLEAFYYVYQDQQFLSQTNNPVGTARTPQLVYYTQNMGEQHIRGAQVDLVAKVTPTTQLTGNLQYLEGSVGQFSYTFVSPVSGSLCKNGGVDPTYDQRYLVNCTGSPLLRAPRWSGTAGISQTVPLANDARVVLSASGNFRTSMWTSQQYLFEQKVPGVAMFDGSIGYHLPGDSLVIEAWIRNATNRVVLTSPGPDLNAANLGSGTALWSSNVMPPRTFGVRVSARFGN